MGSLPDIWCSFGRGIKRLWRSRRNDRQALFLCIFLAEIGNRLSLARSHTHSIAHATAGACSAGADADAGADACWLVAHPPSVHSSTSHIHPTARYADVSFFSLSRNGLGVHDGNNTVGKVRT